LNTIENDSNELTQHTYDQAMRLADKWRLQGRWQDSRTLLNGLLPVSSDLGDSALASYWVLLGRTLIDEGMFRGVDTENERSEVLKHGLEHAETANDETIQGSVWDAMGLSLHAAYLETDRSQEPEHELEYFKRGLAFRQGANDQRGIAESTFHVGLVYGVIRRDHATASPFFEEAYDKAREVDDLVMASYAVRHIAFARRAAGQVETARQDLKESLHLREQAGFTPGVAFALMSLASIEALMGDKDLALDHLERAKHILESLGAESRVIWVESAISRLVSQ
jgi:tetratricopeptide (TPR) repeat protein